MKAADALPSSTCLLSTSDPEVAGYVVATGDNVNWTGGKSNAAPGADPFFTPTSTVSVPSLCRFSPRWDAGMPQLCPACIVLAGPLDA